MKKSLSRSFVALGMGVATIVGAAVIAAPVEAGPPPSTCTAGSPFSSPSNGTPTTCTAPGTLGGPKTVSLAVVMVGASGSQPGSSDDPVSGSGAKVTSYVSVPEGSVLTVWVAEGGHEDGDSAGGGGSSALLLGSTLVMEAGGGGAAGSDDDTTGGSGAQANTAPGGPGGGLAGCTPGGGNTNGAGNGGAAGSATGACDTAEAGETAHAGTAGGSGAQGAGGSGGSGVGAAGGGGAGGTGYANGGDGGASTSSPDNYGGAGGGGGYGGGGGAASGDYLTNDQGPAGGGGGGSYANPAYTAATTFESAGNGVGDSSQGENGSVTFAVAGPTVVTEDSAPTGIGQAGATVHSIVNAEGNNTDVTLEYSTSAGFETVAGTGTPIPAVASGSSDTSVASTLTGLTACTTYYYRVKAASSGGTTVGAVAMFKTACGASAVLPLAVTAKSAGSTVKRSGRTTLVRSATTSNKGKLKASVICRSAGNSVRGDVRLCSYRFNVATGRLVVRTYGKRNVVVRAGIVAVPKAAYRGTVKRSKLFKRSWTTG